MVELQRYTRDQGSVIYFPQMILSGKTGTGEQGPTATWTPLVCVGVNWYNWSAIYR